MSESQERDDTEAAPITGIAIICEKRHHLGEPDVFYPTVFCRFCRERITRATSGNAYWDSPDFAGGPAKFYATRWPMFFAHKSCDGYTRAIEQQRGERFYWMELKEFLRHLCENLATEVPDKHT